MTGEFLEEDELRRRIVEQAARSTSQISVFVHREGGPMFDTFPEVLARSPGDVDVRAIFVMPDGWEDNSEIKEKLRTSAIGYAKRKRRN